LPSRRHPTARAAAAPARLFVDSGAWIALTNPRDQLHEDADRLFRVAVESRIPLITTDLVVAEVHRLLLHRSGPAIAARALDHIEAAENLVVEFVTPDHHRAAREWLSRFADQPITYTEAISFAVMKTRRCHAALTFDRHFEIAGFERWRG
jgi:predicted nucleic acid-binding protein